MQATVRVAALGDIHCDKASQGRLQPIIAQIARSADVVLLCGDLVDYGLPEEAHVLVGEMAPILKMPILAVLGNHDHESNRTDEVCSILCEAGVHMLDGDAMEVRGIGFAAVKGFGGGFGRRALEPWGERAIKDFVREAVDDALRLELALGRLRTHHRIAFTHYAPPLPRRSTVSR